MSITVKAFQKIYEYLLYYRRWLINAEFMFRFKHSFDK